MRHIIALFAVIRNNVAHYFVDNNAPRRYMQCINRNYVMMKRKMTMDKIQIVTLADAFAVAPDVIASWYYGVCPMSDYLETDDCMLFSYVADFDAQLAQYPFFAFAARVNDEVPCQGDYAIHYVASGSYMADSGGRSFNNFNAAAVAIIDHARDIVVAAQFANAVLK
jgi:hypothetical protein